MKNTDLQNPQLNKASPKDLGPLFSDLTNAVLVAQGRALVAERQVSLSIIADPQGLAAEAATSQREMRRSAGFLLSRGVEETSRALAGGASVSNLMRALGARLDAGADPAAVIAATAKSIDRVYHDARDFAEEATRISRGADAASTRFESALVLAAKRIAGDNGAAANLRAEIAQLEEAIDRNLSELVESSKEVGGGAQRLISGFLTSVTDIAANASAERAVERNRKEAEQRQNSPSDNKAEDFDPAAVRKEEAEARGRFAVKDFPIEAIDVAAGGATGVSAAITAFRANRERLSSLIRELAGVDALLAVTSALGAQATGFSRAAADVAALADQLAISWGRLSGDLKDLAADAARTDAGSAERAAVICIALTSTLLWDRLGERILRLEASLSGADDAVIGLPTASAA